jgi:UDP-3-O-acyl N-acetylglucosamine deacetylase
VIPSRNEHTIATSCKIQGRGYWSGQLVTVAIHPAAMGTGVRLVRSDLAGDDVCPANVHHRVDASLRTNLESGTAKFQMVEHLMAALSGLEIDNCLVEVDAEELPALDGSSQGYVHRLQSAGLIVQARQRSRLVVRDRYRIGSPQAWIEAAPSKQGESYFEYQLRFDDDTPIAPQAFGVELTPDRFVRGISPARTFVTEAQANEIRSSGLASHVTNQDLLVIGESGPIDNRFRFENECARHKTLDLIGDLALTGIELVGRFTSFRGGHQLNGQMAKQLLEIASKLTQKTDDSNRKAA